MIVKTWNCTGLAGKLKLRVFRNWLGGADIAAIQETFLTDNSLRVPGFQQFSRPATYGPGGKKYRGRGGLVTLVSSQLSSAFSVSRVEDLQFQGLECLCLKFDKIGARDDLPAEFIVLNVYVTAQPAPFDYGAFFFALEAYFMAFGCPVVVLGDFNAHLRVSPSSLPTARDRDFQEFVLRMGDTGFQHFPSGADLDIPTFISGQGCTVIDYLMVRGAPCSAFKHEDLSDKGHRALRLQIDWPPTTLTALQDRTSYRRHFRVQPSEGLFGDFSAVHGLKGVHDFIRYGLTRVFSLFVLTLGSLFSVARGPRGGSGGEPWHRYLSEVELRPLLLLEGEVAALLSRARLGLPPEGLSEKSAELRALRRSLHSRATERLFGDVKGSAGDPTRFWAFVKKFRVSDEQGVLPIDTLVHHFSAVFNRMSDPIPVVFVGRYPCEDDALDAPFVIEELDRAMGELSRGTAPGGTGVGNDVLLELYKVPGASDFFLNLFNACLEGAELPAVWRCTEIFLLYKGKGLLTDPGSYRGIALMDSCLKLYERLLYGRLAPWAASRDLIPDCQFGFRSGASTLDAIFVFTTLLAKYVGLQSSQMYVALIDFQKAFPSVNRALLIEKLGALGVSDKFRRGLCAIFYCNTFSIRMGEKVTAPLPVTTGLREGSVLSPLLFSLFISDVTGEVLRPFDRREFLKQDPSLNGVPIPGLLYADDLVLFCLTGDLLRERLRRLGDFAGKNQLTVNVSKCEVVVFGAHRSGVGRFRYNGQEMPLRKSCKYLGVWLDADRTDRSLRNAILEKFQGAVPVFFGLCRRLRIFGLDRVFSLAQALLFSLLYGAEFLGNMEVIKRCELAWWSGIRKFYGLPNGVSNATLLLLFPRFSLVHRVLRAKSSISLRALRALPTVFPEALFYDRGLLFERHRRGFLQSIKDWGLVLGLPELYGANDCAEASSMLEEAQQVFLDGTWDTFARMPSTNLAATILANRANFRQVSLRASRFSRNGLRVFLLAITGSFAQSYIKTRACHTCGVNFSFEHLLSCPHLGSDITDILREAALTEDWDHFISLIFGRFQVFVHLHMGGQAMVDQDLCELFQALEDQGEGMD